MKTISERIEYLIDTYANGSAEKFGEMTGIRGETFRKIIKDRTRGLNFKTIEAIGQTFVWLNLNWLVNGTGPVKMPKGGSKEIAGLQLKEIKAEFLLNRIEELAVENYTLKQELKEHDEKKAPEYRINNEDSSLVAESDPTDDS